MVTKKYLSTKNSEELIGLILEFQEEMKQVKSQHQLNMLQLQQTQSQLQQTQNELQKSQILIKELKDDNDKLRAELARAKKYRPSQR